TTFFRSGDEAEVITQLRAMIEQLRVASVEAAPEVFTELVRTLIRSGRGAEADLYRALSERGRSPEAGANAMIVEGVLSPDPAEARGLLSDGVARFEELGMRIDAARAVGDLAPAVARAGAGV